MHRSSPDGQETDESQTWQNEWQNAGFVLKWPLWGLAPFGEGNLRWNGKQHE
jgi:hypothetical protein